MPYNFTTVEKKWQAYWLSNKSFAAIEPENAGDMPKAFVLDMFPYPSGAGLHVGHPEGYTATDIVSRYLRMKGFNVLHPMGWDAFGLPAKQYAIKNNVHPADTTRKNIENFRRQIQMLGLSYDWDREVDTTDPAYYKWTQWIFLQIFNSYFDPIQGKAMPIAHLVNELENENYVVAPDGSVHLNPGQSGMEQVAGEVRIERLWRELSLDERQDVIEGQRLAYTAEVPVNWCPGLGTVLANEEVIDGRSERDDFPVEKRPLRQWMLKITAYADRLLADLGMLDWPESLKEMQRNWIGKSTGAEVEFEVADAADDDLVITVFTTRPDTLYGATYMVLAPEHGLVDLITTAGQKGAVAAYREVVAGKSERDRMADGKEKTGVFTGAHAINPVNDERIPIYIADYVLTGYGTGAIMAVPAHDERDFAFAKKFNLPIRAVVRPDAAWLARMKVSLDEYSANPGALAEAFVGEGVAMNSQVIDGLPTAEAVERIVGVLHRENVGHKTIKYKLRDWLFSRQRYWGEPFPIVLDERGRTYAISEDELPLRLPEMEDFKPTGTPEPPLSKAKGWLKVERDGETFTRETNTMPQWAGSCWYYLRYIDPKNTERLIDPAKEKYWMPVDLYVGGAEHAVLHLLYSRFWHKVLFDLGHVSTAEPFQRLVNQGIITGETEFHAFGVSITELRDIGTDRIDGKVTMVGYRRDNGQQVIGRKVSEEEVERAGDGYVIKGNPKLRVDARSFKMSKSRGNVVNPDNVVKDYGADAFRLYEMYMGPLEAPKPWNTRDIVGMSRFLNSVWRNLMGDEEKGTFGKRISPDAPADALERMLHRTIKKVGEDVQALRFNTAIAELIKLNNELTGSPAVSKSVAETLTLMLAPFAPHLAEELWQALGHEGSLARAPWPKFDEAKLTETTIELPVQVNGKLRDKITVPADADEATILIIAAEAEKVRPWLQEKLIVKRLYVPKKLVNFVVK